MPSGRTSATSAWVRVALVVLLVLMGLVGLGARADAQVFPNSGGSGFIDPHTTSTTVGEYQKVRLTMRWHVPPSAVAGDQIVQTLPPSLDALSLQAFDVYTPDGKTVIGRITLGRDANGARTVVLTFSDAVNGADAAGTNGTASFGLRADRSKLTFVDGKDTIDVYGKPVVVTAPSGGAATDKTGAFVPDQYTATATDASGRLVSTGRQLSWKIMVKPGKWTTATISEGQQAGFVTDCTSPSAHAVQGFTLQQNSGAGHWVDVRQSPDTAHFGAVTCDPSTGAFSVEIAKQSSDTGYYRVTYDSDLTVDAAHRPVYTDANGHRVAGFPASYVNSAVVTVGTHRRPVSAKIEAQTGQAVGQNTRMPLIDIEKYSSATPWQGVQFDANGQAVTTGAPDYESTTQPADDFDTAPGQSLTAGASQLVRFTITNIGSEPLRDLVVTDLTQSGPAVAGTSCDFSAYGGPATGTVGQAAVLPKQASFACTATLPGMAADTAHADTATVVGVGVRSGTSVTDSDSWHAFTPAAQTTPPSTPTPTTPVTTPVTTPPSATPIVVTTPFAPVTTPPAGPSLPDTGTGPMLAWFVAGLAFLGLGSLLVVAARLRRR